MKGRDECIVLGGDIVDFKWSTQGGLAATIEAAGAWLEQLLLRTGDCRIFYLAGNHDCHPAYTDSLRFLASQNPRFEWYEHTLQIRDCLFMHGDILEADACEQRLAVYRKKYHHTIAKHRLLHRSYDLAVHMRIHVAVSKMHHPPKKTCTRLQKFVDTRQAQTRSLIRRVYFGHTHNSIPGLRFGEQFYFNPGATLKNMIYQPIYFELR